MLECDCDGFGNFVVYDGFEDSWFFVMIRDFNEVVYFGFFGEY